MKYRSQKGPFHQEYVLKNESDERRHKGRCVNYSKGHCSFLCDKCIGSSHCEYYQERNLDAGVIGKMDENARAGDAKDGININETSIIKKVDKSSKTSSNSSLNIMKEIWKTVGKDYDIRN